jgi:hypothetical protein
MASLLRPHPSTNRWLILVDRRNLKRHICAKHAKIGVAANA